jgi:hypothetical protein
LRSSTTANASLTNALFDQDWGTVNPETGMVRVHCDDSVAWGNYGAFNAVLIARFQGALGQKFTVECPDNCIKMQTASVWGCNPFMDESSICKAALGLGLITNEVPSKFAHSLC